MSELHLFSQSTQFCDAKGRLTRHGQIFLQGLWNRTGGGLDLPPVFGIVDAAGDGVSDDYLPLQRAIDAAHAAGGGVVRCAPLVYLVGTQLRMKTGVTLDLAGATIRRGFNTSTLGAGLFGFEAGERQTIRGGTLDGHGETYATPFNLISAEDVLDLTIEGVTFLSVVSFHAIDLSGCTNVAIRGCNFFGFHNAGSRQFSEAIQLDPGISAGGTINVNVAVTGCTFGDSQDATLTDFDAWPCAMGNHSGFDGLYHRDIRFADNSVNGASWAGLNLLNMRDVVVSGNTFNDCLHGVRLRLKDDVTPAQACSNVAITGNTFSDIAEASVKFASPTTANIANVTTGRHERISVTGNTSAAEYALVQICFGSQVTVSGNTHRGGNYGIDVRFSSGVTISGNDIRDLEQTGVWVNESTETALAGLGYTSDITVSGNTLRDLGYRGVHVNDAAERVLIASNHVIDCSTADPSREGIRADSACSDITIVGNTVSFSGTVHSPYGISVSGSPTNVTIRGNSAVGSTAPYQVQMAALLDIEGTGSPESVVSAAIGSRYSRLDGGISTATYTKTSGTGSTGWTAMGSGAQLPVGSIHISVDPTDPATTLGYGTWSAFGTGRVVVGVDVGDADFDVVEETGGSKTATF